jgi:hypothetical protein
MLPALATDRSTSASLSSKQPIRHIDLTGTAPKKGRGAKGTRDRHLPLLLPRRYSAAALRQHPTPPHGTIIAANRARELQRANGCGDLSAGLLLLPLPTAGGAGEGAKQRTGYQKWKRPPRHREKCRPRLSDTLTCGAGLPGDRLHRPPHELWSHVEWEGRAPSLPHGARRTLLVLSLQVGPAAITQRSGRA